MTERMDACYEIATTCASCGGFAVPTQWCRVVYCAACAPRQLRHAEIRVKVIEADGQIHYEIHHYLTCTRCFIEGMAAARRTQNVPCPVASTAHPTAVPVSPQSHPS